MRGRGHCNKRNSRDAKNNDRWNNVDADSSRDRKENSQKEVERKIEEKKTHCTIAQRGRNDFLAEMRSLISHSVVTDSENHMKRR